MEQVRTHKLEQKFIGDLIITPDSAGSFLSFLIENISRGTMVAGTSVYKDQLESQVASELVTLRSLPCSRPAGYRVTDDCYPAEDLTIVERGVLRSYLLDLYASRKTGLERSPNTGGLFSIDQGVTPLDDMAGNVETRDPHRAFLGRAAERQRRFFRCRQKQLLHRKRCDSVSDLGDHGQWQPENGCSSISRPSRPSGRILGLERFPGFKLRALPCRDPAEMKSPSTSRREGRGEGTLVENHPHLNPLPEGEEETPYSRPT